MRSFTNPLSCWDGRIPRSPILSSHLFTFSKTIPSSKITRPCCPTASSLGCQPEFRRPSDVAITPRVRGKSRRITTQLIDEQRLLARLRCAGKSAEWVVDVKIEKEKATRSEERRRGK